MAREETELAFRSSDTSLSSDAVLKPFLEPAFDPADFFNQTLPSWRPAAFDTTAPGLAEISNQAQTLLSQLNAQLTRLSNTLTQLTNEILRSGGRLAYEVEILRADASTLSQALTTGLRDDIQRFVPGGINSAKSIEDESTTIVNPEDPSSPPSKGVPPASLTDAPAIKHLTRLHSLAIIRNRLEEVIKVFGDALEWPIAPSEISLKSSFISVSAPEPGAENQSREAKGREYAERVRREIAELVGDNALGEDAFESALSRIEALSDLATVWKGTSEEKARVRFVESLVKLVNDRRKTATGNPQHRMSYHGARGSVSRK